MSRYYSYYSFKKSVIDFQKMPKRKQARAYNVINKVSKQNKFSLLDFKKTHGLFHLNTSGCSGYWPVQVLPDGSVLGHSENLM